VWVFVSDGPRCGHVSAYTRRPRLGPERGSPENASSKNSAGPDLTDDPLPEVRTRWPDRARPARGPRPRPIASYRFQSTGADEKVRLSEFPRVGTGGTGLQQWDAYALRTSKSVIVTFRAFCYAGRPRRHHPPRVGKPQSSDALRWTTDKRAGRRFSG